MSKFHYRAWSRNQNLFCLFQEEKFNEIHSLKRKAEDVNVIPRTRICMKLSYIDSHLRVLNYFKSNNSNHHHHQIALNKMCKSKEHQNLKIKRGNRETAAVWAVGVWARGHDDDFRRALPSWDQHQTLKDWLCYHIQCAQPRPPLCQLLKSPAYPLIKSSGTLLPFFFWSNTKYVLSSIFQSEVKHTSRTFRSNNKTKYQERW